MLKIRRKIVQRQITLEDFMKLKKDGGQFEKMRQDAKGINFSFLFGAVASTFAKLTLEAKWSEADADNYITENRLFKLKDKIIARYPRESPLRWKYLTCATDIRDKFFKTYPGLMKRIDRERKFAIEHGYVRSWHGACRRIPELFLADRDDSGKLIGDDQKLYGRHIGNLLNIAANTSIQNYEAVLVMSAIVDIVNEFKKRKMKSYVFGSVHDSIDLVIHKSEVRQAAEIIERVCTAPRAEAFGMPQEVDIMVANILRDEFYKGGNHWKNYA
jgi:DNA polymerase I-like protein with 3'-5' exonuclease and polymerase domains